MVVIKVGASMRRMDSVKDSAADIFRSAEVLVARRPEGGDAHKEMEYLGGWGRHVGLGWSSPRKVADDCGSQGPVDEAAYSKGWKGRVRRHGRLFGGRCRDSEQSAARSLL
jgi:hypothetical protein